MSTGPKFWISGLPDDADEVAAAVCRSKLFTAINDFLGKINRDKIKITVGTESILEAEPSRKARRDPNENLDDAPVEVRARKYQSQKPVYGFDHLVVSNQVLENLMAAIELIQHEAKIFDEWGLRKIEPYPRSALNFFGEPGTGKTLAAHALASYLNRPIMVASYAQIESKFHGDGPKNVEAIFFSAERDNAVLFIDEADSLLSKRLKEVSQGSEQAINSMRSQLLICLERFKGIVIFATNLVENYDKGFETRIRHVEFPMPHAECRLRIWKNHLPEELPLAPDVTVEALAQIEDVCGRDIKNAVIDAAIRVFRGNRPCIELSDLLQAVDRIKSTRLADRAQGRRLSLVDEQKIADSVANTPPDAESTMAN